MLTVTTAGTNSKLVDVAVVRAALEIDGSAEDPKLNGLIDRASDVLARFCKRVFALETVTEQLRLEQCNQGEIILERYPVVTITSIVADNGNTLVAADYDVDKAKGIITRLANDRPAWWAQCKTTIVYSAGYDLPAAAPGALQQACLRLVTSYYLGADRDPFLRSESVSPMSSASYDMDYLPPDVRGLAMQFRKIK